MGQDLLNPPSVEGWHTGKEWIDTGCLVERINFAAQQVGDVRKPGVRFIVDRLRAAGPLSPEGFVDTCLDLAGPARTRNCSAATDLVAPPAPAARAETGLTIPVPGELTKPAGLPASSKARGPASVETGTPDSACRGRFI